MYADDTTLISTLETFGNTNRPTEIENNISDEISKITTWLHSNKLKLNASKSKFMIFFKHPKIIPKLNIWANGNQIDEIQELNFLGITIDQNITWTPLEGCPQKNCDIFSLLIKYAKNKHLPKKRVKYQKSKHFKSKWMTKRLLNSINTKDRLYKILVQTDTNNILYETMRLNLKTYQRILKNSIKKAKRVYHYNLFSKYKADIKKTWSIIKDTLGKTNSQKNKL